MRLRVKMPTGTERDIDIRTWNQFYNFVEWFKQDDRHVSVEPDGEVFQVVIHDR